MGKVEAHVDPPLLTLIKNKNDKKLDKYFAETNCVGIDVRHVKPL